MEIEIQYINNNSELDRVVETLSQKECIYIDLEFDKNHFRYGFHLCLMQISDGENCYLIDPLPKDIDITKIFKITDDKHIKKICYAFSEDMRLLHHLGACPSNVVDLSVALSLLNYETLSLENAQKTILGEGLFADSKKVDKQKSNWFLRPLSKEQKEYAAADVLYLPMLNEALQTKLDEIGRTAWMEQEMEAFENYNWDDATISSYLQKKDKKKLTRREWIRFKALMEYRENLAEKLDRPTYKVINKNIILDIVAKPEKAENWLKITGVHPKLRTPKVQDDIQSLLATAEKQIQVENIKVEDPAMQRLSKDESLFIKERNRRTKLLTTTFFEPIKGWITKYFGENFTHYFLSNRKVMLYSHQEIKMLPYQMKLVQEAANELQLELPSAISTSIQN